MLLALALLTGLLGLAILLLGGLCRAAGRADRGLEGLRTPAGTPPGGRP